LLCKSFICFIKSLKSETFSYQADVTVTSVLIPFWYQADRKMSTIDRENLMVNSMEEFTKEFGTLSQKDARRLVNRKGRSRLGVGAFNLLKYLVTNAWFKGAKRLVEVSRKAMATNTGLSVRAVDRNLKALTDNGLITIGEDGIDLHCESMHEWTDMKILEHEKKLKRREAQAKYSRSWTQEDEDAHVEWAMS
jgi:DNA-binding transcriptional ArsR family regulator